MANDKITVQLLEKLRFEPGFDILEVVPSTNLPARICVPNSPIATIRPQNAAQISDLVRAAEHQGVALLPVGGATHLRTGAPMAADRPYLAIDMRGMNHIIDHQPDDLTVTCEPGVTFAQLQARLAAKGQSVPIDIPHADRATIGGIVSTNASGFHRPAYGSPRDLVIGVRAIITEGAEVKGGGKVVKNVAGYDVCKLFTGAWGTLGILTEITFRVRPLPESTLVMKWSASDLATACTIGHELYLANLALTYVLATNELDGKPSLIVGIHGTSARQEWQREELVRRTTDRSDVGAPQSIGEGDSDRLLALQARIGDETVASVRVSCLPTEVPLLLARLAGVRGMQITAHAANGIVNIGLTDLTPATIGVIIGAIPSSAGVVWTRMDEPIAGVSVWGTTRGEFALHRGIKQAIDPSSTFSPGRFIGGL